MCPFYCCVGIMHIYHVNIFIGKDCHFIFFHTLDLDPVVKLLGLNFTLDQ
jgi:hypothetical protein